MTRIYCKIRCAFNVNGQCDRPHVALKFNCGSPEKRISNKANSSDRDTAGQISTTECGG